METGKLCSCDVTYNKKRRRCLAFQQEMKTKVQVHFRGNTTSCGHIVYGRAIHIYMRREYRVGKARAETYEMKLGCRLVLLVGSLQRYNMLACEISPHHCKFTHTLSLSLSASFPESPLSHHLHGHTFTSCKSLFHMH